MAIAISIGLLLLLVLLFFLRSDSKRGEYVYTLAKDFENCSEHESACFHYAVAMNAGYNKLLCQNKIRELWQNHGPFDFKKQLEEAKAEFCRYESCGEGIHSLTVEDIHKIVK